MDFGSEKWVRTKPSSTVVLSSGLRRIPSLGKLSPKCFIIIFVAGSKQTLIPVLCRKEDDAPVFITSRHSIKWDDPQKFDKMFKVTQKLK